MDADDDNAALLERLYQTSDLFDVGLEMMAANLRRKHPDATAEQIDELLDQWLADRPMPGEISQSKKVRPSPPPP